MQNTPPVPHGEELASPYLHKILLVDYLKGRIYAKSKKSRYLAISLQMTMNLITTFHSLPLIICDYISSSSYAHVYIQLDIMLRIYCVHVGTEITAGPLIPEGSKYSSRGPNTSVGIQERQLGCKLVLQRGSKYSSRDHRC